MRKSIIFSLLALCTLVLAGCSSTVAIAPSTTPLTGEDVFTKLGRTSGSSTSGFIFFIPFGTTSPVRSALAEALEKTGADGLVEVTVDKTVVNFLYLFGTTTTTVEGTAIKIEREGKNL